MDKLYVCMEPDHFITSFTSTKTKGYTEEKELWVAYSDTIKKEEVIYVKRKVVFTYTMVAIKGDSKRSAVFSSVWGEDNFNLLVARFKHLASQATEAYIAGPVGTGKLYEVLRDSMTCCFSKRENNDTIWIDTKVPQDMWLALRGVDLSGYVNQVEHRSYPFYDLDFLSHRILLLRDRGSRGVLPFTYEWQK